MVCNIEHAYLFTIMYINSGGKKIRMEQIWQEVAKQDKNKVLKYEMQPTKSTIR